ncbi:MAG TPA: sulfate adenylyltransferase, partial [Gammaproteobacteria bacterium]|nr:sulfate adenylyltransferase [Gammaproteobacteria bacterium]
MSYYGEKSLTRMLSQDESEQFKKDIPVNCNITLSQRQLCDLEMILNGAMSPLNGFMGEKDYNSVVENLSLDNSLMWSLPVTLDVSKEQLDDFDGATQVGLCDG